MLAHINRMRKHQLDFYSLALYILAAVTGVVVVYVVVVMAVAAVVVVVGCWWWCLCAHAVSGACMDGWMDG